MINLIVFFIIFIIIIYLIFHLFVLFSKSFNLIDEKFSNMVKNIKDKHINNLFKEKDTEKRLNKYLRYDFLICLLLGILWFLFPILLINLNINEKLTFVKTNKYLGKYLGLFTVISSIITLFYLKKENKEKIRIIYTKLFCCILIIISLFVNVWFLKRIEITYIINLFLLSIWMGNSVLGILDYHNIMIL